MMNRFQKIRNEFGLSVLLRIIILLIGLVFMSLIGIFLFSSFSSLIIAIVGIVIGFFAKNKIPDGIEYYQQVFRIGLFIYGIILFLGDRFGIENNWKLIIITITTVIVFNLQFWSLSDSSVINTEKFSE